MSLVCLSFSSSLAYSQDTQHTPIDLSNVDQLHVCATIEMEIELGKLVWLADGNGLIVADFTSVWKLDLANPEELLQLSAQPVEDIVISKSGNRLAGNSVDEVYIWDTDNEFVLKTLDIKRSAKLWLNQDGSLLAYNLSSPNKDLWEKSIVVWDVETNREIKRFEFESPVSSFVVDEAANRLFSAHANGIILVTDLDTGEQIYEQDEYGRSITKAVLSNDATMLAYSGDRRMLHLWHMKEGEIITIDLPAPLLTLDFTPDGSLLASVPISEKIISIRKSSDGMKVSELNTGEEGIFNVFSLAFNPDGTMLASADLDGTLKLWGIDC